MRRARVFRFVTSFCPAEWTSPFPAADEGVARRRYVATSGERGPSPLDAADTFYEIAIAWSRPRTQRKRSTSTPRTRSSATGTAGIARPGLFARRRLIEAGVRFVTVTDGGWDTHQNNFAASRTACCRGWTPGYPAAPDLEDRGLLDSTLVAVLSDFGRTPKVNPSAGRDHWSSAGFALLAGGGFRAGWRSGGPTRWAAADRGAVSHRGCRRDHLSSSESRSTQPTKLQTDARFRSTTMAG